MNIIEKLKKDTIYNKKIIYRTKYIGFKKIHIIYNELLVDSTKVSDFIFKSLDNIKYKSSIYKSILNNIYNFKYKELKYYDDIKKYLNIGYTIIVIKNKYIALETKKALSRSISTPETDVSLRGAKDAFIENYETNLGLIKKRIKSDNLSFKEYEIGNDTKTQVVAIYMEDKANKVILNNIINKFKNINKNIVGIDDIKKTLMIKKLVFPVCKTTERPDLVCKALLAGKIVIMCDNSNYALILPITLNDFFKTSDDLYSNKLHFIINRLLKYIAFITAIIAPALYIALITYNQEIIPTSLLIEFTTQRANVPFPAFFEAFIMLLAFELLKEADLRTPGVNGNSISIVGALILGDAAVSASIVSSIMIIVIALSAICSLPFQEPEITNSIRVYRTIFMISASFLGIIGIIASFIFLLIRLNGMTYYNQEYLKPLAPPIIKED